MTLFASALNGHLCIFERNVNNSAQAGQLSVLDLDSGIRLTSDFLLWEDSTQKLISLTCIRDLNGQIGH